MTPAIIPRQQVGQSVEQVMVAAAADLHDRQPAGRVRHEDLQQAVTARRDLVDEPLRDRREVGHTGMGAGVDRKFSGLHPRSITRYHPPPCGSPGEEQSWASALP